MQDRARRARGGWGEVVSGVEAVEAVDRLIESVRKAKRCGQRFPIGFEKELLAVRAFVVSRADSIQLELFTAASDA